MEVEGGIETQLKPNNLANFLSLVVGICVLVIMPTELVIVIKILNREDWCKFGGAVIRCVDKF